MFEPVGRPMTDVSVVVPTRNRSALLATTLRSVLRQRHVDIEVVVVDEASTDDTTQIVGSFDDARLRTVRHEVPLGPNAARNRGAREAQGTWIAFVDDDDLWSPDKLARQIAAAEESGRDWVYAGSVNVNERLDIVHGLPPPSPPEVLTALPRYNAIPASASNVVIRRSSFAATGGFNEDLHACEEWDLWLRLAGQGPPAWVPSPLLAYRMHAGNAILDVAALVEGARRLERLHDIRIDWGRFHWWVAQLCARNGQRGEALRQYGRAALAGRAGEVGADLAGVVRRRLGRIARPPARRTNEEWEEDARGWLDELRRLELTATGWRR